MAEYIERDAVMQEFANRVRRSNNSDFAPTPTWNKAVQIVEDFPAADVAPVRRGRWKGEHKRGSFSHPDSITYECSECGYSVYTIYGFPHLPNYCPNCGAHMTEGEQDG